MSRCGLEHEIRQRLRIACKILGTGQRVRIGSPPAAGRDTFRIEVENDALKGLTNNDTVIVTFSALLPKASELDLEQ